jgi:hypothetical protein
MSSKDILCTTHRILPLRARLPGAVTRVVEKKKEMLCVECAIKACKGDKERERVVLDVVLAPIKAAILSRSSPSSSPLPSPHSQLEAELFGSIT